MKYFEDIRLGETLELGQHTFTADEIKAFAARYDPQPFHLDEEAGAQSHFGALCASGWHTACIWIRQVAEHHRRVREDLIRRGEPFARIGPSPGFRDLKWLRPVFANDTISYASEVIEMRPLRSRAGWGVLTMRNVGINQHGETVLSFLGAVFVERRSADFEAE
jgi:acyl dehydratase